MSSHNGAHLSSEAPGCLCISIIVAMRSRYVTLCDASLAKCTSATVGMFMLSSWCVPPQCRTRIQANSRRTEATSRHLQVVLLWQDISPRPHPCTPLVKLRRRVSSNSCTELHSG